MNDEQSFWLHPLVDLEKNLNSSQKGLTTKEAKLRLKQFGQNLISQHQKRNLLFEFLSRFRNPLVILLVLASAFSFFVGQIQDASIILIIVMFSVFIDFFQEYRAGKAAEKLSKSVALKSIVLRDGQKSEIFSSEIVPGDIVFLTAGNLVPADGRLLFANDVFANQALLTGESFPVEKTCRDLTEKEDDLTHATNAIFMGSSLISGQAQMLVCETGFRTFLGSIADVLEKPSSPSVFEIGTRQFGYLLMRITIFLTLFV